MPRYLPILIVVASLSSILCATAAQAGGTFCGNGATLELYYPNLGTLDVTIGTETVVCPGVEFPEVLIGFPSGEPVWSADVDTATIVLNHLDAGINDIGCGSGTDPFNGFVFTFPGLAPPIAGVTLNASSTLIPFNFWATANQVFVDYQCLGIIQNNVSTILDVTFVTKCKPPPSGMVAWWPLDELTGGTATDIVGGYNGTHVNGPTPLAGEYVDNSLCFDGTNDYVDASPGPNVGTGDFTIDAWVKRDPANTNSPPSVIVDKRDSNGIGYSLAVSFGRLVLLMADGINDTHYFTTGASCVPADDQWHFVAVTVDRAGVVQFYCDCNPHDTDPVIPVPGDLDNAESLRIGAGFLGGNQPWLGCIDELELFNRALTLQEVQSICNAGTAGKCKACEPLPDGSGCTNAGCDCFGECIDGGYCDDPNCCLVPGDCLCYSPNSQESIKLCGDCFGECIGGSYCESALPGCAAVPGAPVCYVPNHHYSIYLCGDCFGQCIDGGYCDGPNPDCCIEGPGTCACYSPTHPNSIKMCGEQQECRPTCMNYDPITQVTLVTDCDCGGANECHVVVPAPGTGPPKCVDDCPPGEICEQTETLNADGTIDVCCRCVAPPCEPPPSGMVAWWPLDEQTGATLVRDVAGSFSDNGTPFNSPIGAAGAPSTLPAVVGTGLSFPAGISPTPGPNVYVEVPSGPEVNFGAGDFSIDTWIRLGPVADNIYPIVDKLESNKGYALFVQNGQLLLRLGPDDFGGMVGAVSNFSSPMTLGPWYYVAVTVKRDPSKPQVTFYVNGVQDGPIPTAGPNMGAGNNISNAAPLWIGGNSRLAGGGATVSRGEITIDELEFFQRELTPTEVQDIYDAGSAGKCKCEPLPDGSGCQNTVCPNSDEICKPTQLFHDPSTVPPTVTVAKCECVNADECYIGIVDLDMFEFSCEGAVCPGTNEPCGDLTKMLNPDGITETIFCCSKEPPPEMCALPLPTGPPGNLCEQLQAGSCINGGPNDLCRPTQVIYDPNSGQFAAEDCDCVDAKECYVDFYYDVIPAEPFCNGLHCPGTNSPCELTATPGPGGTTIYDCCSPGCEPLADGSDCTQTVCSCVCEGGANAGASCICGQNADCPGSICVPAPDNQCKPTQYTQYGSGQPVVTKCDCVNVDQCSIAEDSQGFFACEGVVCPTTGVECPPFAIATVNPFDDTTTYECCSKEGPCPLEGNNIPYDPCLYLQGRDCNTDAGPTCLPLAVQIYDSPIGGQPGPNYPRAEKCACAEQFAGPCGPVTIKADPDGTDYALSCFGNCGPPIVVPCESCQVLINGVSQGQDTVFTPDLTIDDVVTCDCVSVFDPCKDAPDSLAADPADVTLGVGKNRYLSFSAPPAATAGVSEQAIRVTLDSVAGFSGFNGEVRWVGPPQEFTDEGLGTFTAAQLQCDPHFADWTGIDLINVYGKEVVPGSSYTAQRVDFSCSSLADESCYSVPLTVGTGQWGDVAAPFEGAGAAQPDFTDIANLVDKFTASPTAPPKARAQLAGDAARPNFAIDFNDIAADIDAFTGASYPFAGPSACP